MIVLLPSSPNDDNDKYDSENSNPSRFSCPKPWGMYWVRGILVSFEGDNEEIVSLLTLFISVTNSRSYSPLGPVGLHRGDYILDADRNTCIFLWVGLNENLIFYLRFSSLCVGYKINLLCCKSLINAQDRTKAKHLPNQPDILRFAHNMSNSKSYLISYNCTGTPTEATHAATTVEIASRKIAATTPATATTTATGNSRLVTHRPTSCSYCHYVRT